MRWQFSLQPLHILIGGLPSGRADGIQPAQESQAAENRRRVGGRRQVTPPEQPTQDGDNSGGGQYAAQPGQITAGQLNQQAFLLRTGGGFQEKLLLAVIQFLIVIAQGNIQVLGGQDEIQRLILNYRGRGHWNGRPGGRLEANPAVAGKENLDPAVAVAVGNDIDVLIRNLLAYGVAGNHPGRNALSAEQHGHRRGKVFAVAAPLVKQEMIHPIGIVGRRVHRQGIGQGFQIGFDGFGLIVRGFRAGGQFRAQIPHPLRQFRRQLRVFSQSPSGIVEAGQAQILRFGLGYGGGYCVGFAPLELPPGAAEGQSIGLFRQGFRQNYPLHLAALTTHIRQLEAGRHGGGQAGAAGGPAGLPQFPLQAQGGDIQSGRGRYRRRPGKIQGVLRRVVGFNLHLPVHRQNLPAGEKVAGRVVQRYRVRNLKALGVGLRHRVARRPVRRLQHRVIGNPAFGRISAIAAGFPIQGHRGIHLQHRRSRGIYRPLKSHHIAPDAVGQRPPGRQAGEKAVEIVLKAHQRRPHIFIDIMGRLPETAGGQQQKGNQQHRKGHQYAVGYGQDAQVAVGLKAQPPPFPQAAHRLHPGHQQQGGKQVDAQVDAALGRQIGQVGQQPGAAQDKDAPKVAVAEKYPRRQIAGQPGGDHQAKGKGFPVNVDAAGAGRVVP